MMKEILFNFDKIKSLDITPNEYIYLYYKAVNQPCDINDIVCNYKKLETNGFIKISEDQGIILRAKGRNLFKAFLPEALSNLTEKYRELFPQGVKSGGRLVKGDVHGCLTKLKAFKTKYPQYTDEDILDATKAYVDNKRKFNWDKMICADYFIEKDKSSMLASYCEDIKIRGKQEEKKNLSSPKGV